MVYAGCTKTCHIKPAIVHSCHWRQWQQANIKNIRIRFKRKNDKRWRIEHAQVINENDFHFFADYKIIPSVQPTHATSDMYWTNERLGEEREKIHMHISNCYKPTDGCH